MCCAWIILDPTFYRSDSYSTSSGCSFQPCHTVALIVVYRHSFSCTVHVDYVCTCTVPVPVQFYVWQALPGTVPVRYKYRYRYRWIVVRIDNTHIPVYMSKCDRLLGKGVAQKHVCDLRLCRCASTCTLWRLLLPYCLLVYRYGDFCGLFVYLLQISTRIVRVVYSIHVWDSSLPLR